MHLLLVTFALAGISDADLRARAEAVAPHFAALPGLRSKVWLADPGSGTYGGVYLWDDRAAADAYAGGELFAGAVARNPAFADVTVRGFEVLEGPSRITGAERLSAA